MEVQIYIYYRTRSRGTQNEKNS